ncbi:MAG: efflux RND transporter periplasmic adaptor subunit [Planctomycetes bacterium]|nr:efflux RND transporter periplasmic adaptor subunit [Planctomycetota bacterium]
MHRLIVGVGSVVVVLAASACSKPQEAAAPQAPAAPQKQPAPAAAGERVAVRRGDVRETLSAIGSFTARRTSRLGPQVSGRVEAVLVDVGDVVRTGQVLARLDPKLLAIEVDQASAAVASANARAAALEQTVLAAEADVRQVEARQRETAADLERMKTLWEKPTGGTPSIPRSRYDDAVFRHEQATAAIDAAKSRAGESRARVDESRVAAREADESLRHAKQRLDEAAIVAPFDGVVSQRLVDPGESVTSAPVTHLLEIQETGTLELVFSLPQGLIGATRAGTVVEFDVEGVPDGAGAAAVEIVFPSVDEATRSFRCRAIVDNTAAKYRPGLLAQVRVVAREAKGVLVVPTGAVVRSSEGWRVSVETAGGTETRSVELGIAGTDVTEVRSGLVEGDRVVVPSHGAVR